MENNRSQVIPGHRVVVLRAEREDLPAILEIYNQAVIKTSATFDTEPKSLEDQIPWWNAHGDRLPIFVAKVDGLVAGWASLSPFSDRAAYDRTAEDSLYVHEDFRGQGLGKRLMGALMTHVRTTDIHRVISRIAGDNQVSMSLHEAFGFKIKGILTEVGFKFGRYIDVRYYQWSPSEVPNS